MKIHITVEREPSDPDDNRDQLRRVQLALLSLFAMVDDVFTEDDALSKPKRRMSLGRIYEEWKRCRATLDPTFNPKNQDRRMKYGAMLVRPGLSRGVRD